MATHHTISFNTSQDNLITMNISIMQHLPFITMLMVFLITCNIYRVHGQCLQDQKAILLKLRNGLTFDSSKSEKLVRWDESTDCCLWPGVSCDRDGHVFALELENETISDGVDNSSSLFDLQYLEKLNLAHNYDENLVQVPTEIYKLANLKYLNLSYSGFAGQIPMELSRLTELEFLDLSFSYYFMLENPNLKTLVGNLTNLRELYLDYVPISLKGSELCSILSSSLSQLRVLSMISCDISGPLDPVLLNLRFLSVIRLDGNRLSSTVPEFLANFTELTTLSLAGCELRGAFPSKIFQVPTLQKLDLTFNDLTGTLPEFSGKSALREMLLGDTSFSGSLSDSITNLRTLTRLDLRGCKLRGHIPSTIGNLTNLVQLDLSFCNLGGPIPSTIRKITDLEFLDLSFNNFTGSIPLFHKARKLRFINLSNNNLAGPSSSAHLAILLSLPSLQSLYLQNNHVSGEVHEFANASSSVLETLDLSSNHLNGSIPRSIFELKMLSELLLSFNSLSGTINLNVIEGLPRLVRLDLSYNNLRIDTHGSNLASFHFPKLEKMSLASCGLQKFPNLRNMSSLRVLDLSSNNIKGEIPSWVWRVGALNSLNLSCNLLESLGKPYYTTSLMMIDLHSNRIKGNLPIISTSLSYFSIANNKLTGSIPSSICNLTALRFFDMSNNAMNGKIPPCLFQEDHTVLNLARNKLSGVIPNAFPVNCGLRALDLSNNILEGKVPRSLQRCTDLEVLDIENNKIRDKFPCMLYKLPNLHVLVFRSNRFYGNLQCPIANYTWPRIQILDLASNNFSGALIPQYFSKWEGMMLSRNPERVYLDAPIITLYTFDYQYMLTLFYKGLRMKNMKILTFFTSVDLSCNNFQEEIPERLGDLKLLNHLNLSHNALTGRIPKTLGKLTKLEALDLSGNHLSGRIPDELASLTFLTFLNLSFNQLSGRIPKGNQIQTFSADSFEGNIGLCDFPLKKLCTHTVNGLSQPSSHSEHEADEKYISFALGSSVGFGIVIWLLLHSPRYNELIERVLLKILDHHVGGRNVWRSS